MSKISFPICNQLKTGIILEPKQQKVNRNDYKTWIGSKTSLLRKFKTTLQNNSFCQIWNQIVAIQSHINQTEKDWSVGIAQIRFMDESME